MNSNDENQPPPDRAVRAGDYSFHFTHIVPEPTDPEQLRQTMGFLVQAGLMVSHDSTMSHHGDSLINAAYSLFNTQSVDAMITQKQDEARGHLNGTGGMSGAVVLTMRAVMNMNKILHVPREGGELNKLAVHIFGRREVERAMDEVRATR